MCIAYPGTRYYFGRTELKRGKQGVMPSFREVRDSLGLPESCWNFNENKSCFTFYNGSEIEILDLKYAPSDPLYERYGSLLYTSGWIEEGGEVPFNAFDTLKSRVNRWKNKEYGIMGKTYITCNPKKNWLYNYFWRPWKKNQLPADSCFIPALYSDNSYTADDYGESLASIKDVSKRERLMKGNWQYVDDPSSIVDYDSIINMFTRQKKGEGKKFLIVDVARYGRDESCVFYFEGWDLLDMWSFAKNSTVDLSTFVKSKEASKGVARSNVIVDSDGVGGGVVDELPGCKAFVNGSSPIIQPRDQHKKKQHIYEENYTNLKAQCIFHAAEQINNNVPSIYEGISEKDKEMLIEELEQWKRKDFDNDEKKAGVISKEDVKENIGRSPDRSDCFFMRSLGDLAHTSFGARAINPRPNGKSLF